MQTLYQLIWKPLICWARLTCLPPLWNFLLRAKKVFFCRNKKMLNVVLNNATGKPYYFVERLPKYRVLSFNRVKPWAWELSLVMLKYTLFAKENRLTIFRSNRSTKKLTSVKDVAIKYDMAYLKTLNSFGWPGKRHGSKESNYTPQRKHRSSSLSIIQSANYSMINAWESVSRKTAVLNHQKLKFVVFRNV